MLSIYTKSLYNVIQTDTQKLRMEYSIMTRTKAREIAVHLVYDLSFGDRTADEVICTTLNREEFGRLGKDCEIYTEFPNDKQRKYIETVLRGVDAHGPELDGYIAKYSIGWNFSRIPRIATAIMKIAMYEILYMPDIPEKASVNEAVELAKKYEDSKTVSFINGILGTFLRDEAGFGKAGEKSGSEE